MAFNFPNSPTDQMPFTPYVGGPSYIWDAATSAWKYSGGGAGGGGSASLTVSDTPPASPQPNQLWWESDSAALYLYYGDPDSSQWIMIAPGGVSLPQSSVLPAGAVNWFAMNAAPAGWLKANGASVSRTAYPSLFAAIGTTYGSVDASTFTLPDIRGEFIRGWDDGRGSDTGRAFGSVQTDALQNITGGFKLAGGGGGVDGHSGVFYQNNAPQAYGPQSSPAVAGVGNCNFDASRVARTATETRPHNVALLACIKF